MRSSKLKKKGEILLSFFQWIKKFSETIFESPCKTKNKNNEKHSGMNKRDSKFFVSRSKFITYEYR